MFHTRYAHMCQICNVSDMIIITTLFVVGTMYIEVLAWRL